MDDDDGRWCLTVTVCWSKGLFPNDSYLPRPELDRRPLLHRSPLIDSIRHDPCLHTCPLSTPFTPFDLSKSSVATFGRMMYYQFANGSMGRFWTSIYMQAVPSKTLVKQPSLRRGEGKEAGPVQFWPFATHTHTHTPIHPLVHCTPRTL